MTLKQLRIEKKLSQVAAASLGGVSRRSYQIYEKQDGPKDAIRYQHILGVLSKVGYIDEEHGVFSSQQIWDIVQKVSAQHPVSFVILFGSYAKNQARDDSDVDLLVSTEEKGLHFYGLVEDYRVALHKKVDVLGLEQLNNNPALVAEILKDGIRIYG